MIIIIIITTTTIIIIMIIIIIISTMLITMININIGGFHMMSLKFILENYCSS